MVSEETTPEDATPRGKPGPRPRGNVSRVMISMTATEREVLEALAQLYGKSYSEVMRDALREFAARHR